MTTARIPTPAPTSRVLSGLRARLAEAAGALRAVRRGEVDTVVVASKQGRQVFTLQGADEPYRVLVESMNDGALTLTADETILYANQSFARMVKRPLKQVVGGPFGAFLNLRDQLRLRKLLKRAGKGGSKIQVPLKRADKSQITVQVSIRSLGRNGVNGATSGLLVTDKTEARQKEGMLRALTHRVVEAQEAERGRVARELHDHITQLLCAIAFRSQALVERRHAVGKASRWESMKIRSMLGDTINEVERISQNLRPSALDHLGLVALLRETSSEFANRTGVPVELAYVQMAERLPADMELALYRILQEALKNIEEHARAEHVRVRLRRRGSSIQLSIADDGVGFDSAKGGAARSAQGGLGLLGMRERAAYVSGALTIKSELLRGTEVEVRIPVPTATARRRRLLSA